MKSNSLLASTILIFAVCVLGLSANVLTVRAALPVVQTLAPTNVTPSSAVLQGLVTPDAELTTSWLFFRADGGLIFCPNPPGAVPPSFGSVAPAPVPVSCTLSGLNPSTTYQYMLVGRNTQGVTQGNAVTFTTPAAPPPVSTQQVTSTQILTQSSTVAQTQTVAVTRRQTQATTQTQVQPQTVATAPPGISSLITVVSQNPIAIISLVLVSVVSVVGALSRRGRSSRGNPPPPRRQDPMSPRDRLPPPQAGGRYLLPGGSQGRSAQDPGHPDRRSTPFGRIPPPPPPTARLDPTTGRPPPSSGEIAGLNPQPEPPRPEEIAGLNPQPEPPGRPMTAEGTQPAPQAQPQTLSKTPTPEEQPTSGKLPQSPKPTLPQTRQTQEQGPQQLSPARPPSWGSPPIVSTSYRTPQEDSRRLVTPQITLQAWNGVGTHQPSYAEVHLGRWTTSFFMDWNDDLTWWFQWSPSARPGVGDFTIHDQIEYQEVESAVWQVSLYPFTTNSKNWYTERGLVGTAHRKVAASASNIQKGFHSESLSNQIPVPPLGQWEQFQIDFGDFAPNPRAAKPRSRVAHPAFVLAGGFGRPKSGMVAAPVQSGQAAQVSVDNVFKAAKEAYLNQIAMGNQAKSYQGQVIQGNVSAISNAETGKPLAPALRVITAKRTDRLSYFVRVVALDSQGQCVGEPSNAVQILYGETDPVPPTPFNWISKTPANPTLPSVKIICYETSREKASDWYNHVIVTALGAQLSFGVHHEGEKLDLTPKEKSWWDEVEDAIGSIVDAIGDVVNFISKAFEELKDFVVDAAFVFPPPFGLKGVEEILALADITIDMKAVAKAGLEAGLVAIGVPPTLPNFDQLTALGKGYLTEAITSGIEDYTGVPVETISEIAANGGANGLDIRAMAANTIDQMIEQAAQKESGDGLYRPDPDYMYKPAILWLRVRPHLDNGNVTNSDTVSIYVNDVNHVFKPASVKCPAMKSENSNRQEIDIPIFLTEYSDYEWWKYTQGLTECADAWNQRYSNPNNCFEVTGGPNMSSLCPPSVFDPQEMRQEPSEAAPKPYQN